CFFFFQAEDGIRDATVTGVQTCALPISLEQALVACLQPSWFPLIVTDGGAQSQHRIDMRALPAHASPFESGLDDPFVGTFHTARSEERRVGKECRYRRSWDS